MSGDAQSLAAALDFDSMNADIQQTLENGDYSFLGKRPNTSQPAGGFGSMLHVRAESNSGRRHSIQTLMPSSDSSSSLTGFGPMAGAVSGARSMSISVDAYGSMAYTDAANHGMDMAFNAEAHNTSGAGFLMSPPRLTVSMSNNADHASAAAAATFNEDAKRRRTSEVDATPERRVEQLANEHRFLPQQTPPNMYAYQQHPQFSLGSSVGGGFETPSSVQSSASPCRVRRLSLTAMDRAPISPTLPPTLRSPPPSAESSHPRAHHHVPLPTPCNAPSRSRRSAAKPPTTRRPRLAPTPQATRAARHPTARTRTFGPMMSKWLSGKVCTSLYLRLIRCPVKCSRACFFALRGGGTVGWAEARSGLALKSCQTRLGEISISEIRGCSWRHEPGSAFMC